LPDPDKCLPNAGAFARTNWSDAQRLATALGHDVTPTEVLAVAGNESSYGSLERGLAKYGNFFGLHGSGPAGTYYTKGTQYNRLFAGADCGGERAAAMYSLLETAGSTA
jgi:hypothetical protein